MSRGHRPGGGIASKQRVEKPIRYGAAGGAREVHVKGVSQIGTSIGNKVTGKGKNLTDTIRPVRGSPFGQMGSVKLGNELEIEQQQASELPDTPRQEFDPWLNLLETVETRAGVKQVYDSDGNREFRVATRYLLESVIGVAAERVNYSHASVRLGKLMRRLGWDGPKDLRLNKGSKTKTKGYRKAEIKEAA